MFWHVKARAKTIEQLPTHVRPNMPNPTLETDADIVLGMHSFYYTMKGMPPHRVMRSDRTIWLDDKTPITESGAARTYLTIKYPNMPFRARSNQIEAWTNPHRSTPLYARAGIGNGAYLDLKNAFWTIVQAVGFNLEYMPNKYLGIGANMEDFPFFMYRLSRNSLVSLGLSSTMAVWNAKKQRVDYRKTGARTKNLGLWALVCDTLNAVAADVVRAGAVYWYTDGGIVPQYALYDAISAIESYGLQWHVDEIGEYEVRTAGSYRVGNKYTKRALAPRDVAKIHTPANPDWLRENLYLATRRTNFIYHDV